MRFLLPLLLLTFNSFAQLSPVVSYVERIKFDWVKDSVRIDTLKLEGSFLTIKIDSQSIVIPGLDSLTVVSIEAQPDSIFRFVLNKITRNKTDTTEYIEVMEGITAILSPDFFYLQYPRLRTKQNTPQSAPSENVYTSYSFTLVREMKSVSN